MDKITREQPELSVAKEFKRSGRSVIAKICGMRGFCVACGVEKIMSKAYEIRIGYKTIVQGSCETCGGEMFKKEKI